MPSAAAVLYPLAVLLLVPLLGAVLVRGAWGRAATARGRLGRAAAALALGGGATAAVLAGFVLRADRCRAEPRGALADADSFVVFAFGLGPDANGGPAPGASNRALARWLLDHNPDRKPAAVQEGVYLALAELGATGAWVIRLPDPPGAYVDTLGAAYQAGAVLHQQGRTRPAVVAHDLQLARAAWSCAAVGLSDCVVPDLPPTPFDPASVQHAGTRYESAWVPRELLFARPITLRPKETLLLVAAVALLYGLAAGRLL